MGYRKRDSEIILKIIRYLKSINLRYLKSINLRYLFKAISEFPKDSQEVLILVILAIMAEYFHLLFVNIPFNDVVNLNAPIYYLVSQFGLLTFIPSLILFKWCPKKKRASKAILLGLVLWNLKEVMDEMFYICKINYNVLKTEWGQVALIITIVMLCWLHYLKRRY